MSHNGYVTKLQDVRPHSNADRLQLATVFGNQVVVSLDAKEGDIGIYFPTDLKLGIEYAQKNDLLRRKDELGNDVGGYLDPDKRHIRSLKLRGEFSDGLFMPLSSLASFTNIFKLQVGDIVKEYDGVLICEKYVPYQKPRGENIQGPSKKKKSQFVQFKEHIDTKQLAYSLGEFKEGDLCYITGKLHGTSGRTTYTIQERDKPQNWLQKLLKKKPVKETLYAKATGTRRVVLNLEDQVDKGFYGDNDFRKKYHDLLAPKLFKGETIYYEIVGYVAENQPIMPTCDNKKINDKAFVKTYGPTTTFSYGCANGENDIYVYRMTMTNEDGYVIEYPQGLIGLRCEQMGIKMVPQLDLFIYATEEDMLARVDQYVGGPDFIDPTHIREGVVVRIANRETFKVYKSKDIYFKILEGIIKEDATEPDMEEMEEE